ncbi:MAG: hypothetical protein ABIP89_24660 [Polyangiaceae bacterium]
MIATRPILTLLPDYDDPDPTALAALSYMDDEPTQVRGHRARESYIRLRPGTRALHEHVETFARVMNDDQLNLGMKLLNVTHSMDGFPYDVSARAAAGALRRRYFDVSDVADALNELYFATQHSTLAPLFDPDASVAPFLKGLYIWCDGVVEALSTLGAELRVLQPDWTELRKRLADASQFYFDGLVPQIRSQIEALRVEETSLELEEFAAVLEEVFFSVALLEQSLQSRFG